MKNSKPNQCVRIVTYMQENGTITSWEAMKELGCMRLASRISELKRKGYLISRRMVSSVNRYGEKVSFAEYFFEQ